MITLNCPSCGANVTFRSKASVFAVCTFCKATLVRQDLDLKSIGKMAELQDDLTPLQIGSTGKFDGKQFEIIGRLKVGYSDGVWNEWYTLFPADKTGWLAEAQGFYAMCFSVSASQIPKKETIQPGMSVDLSFAGTFQIEDIHSVKCLFSEGELPVDAVQGRQSVSVDLTGPDNQMATIEYADDSIRVFAGNYKEFDQFAFRNLRQFDGW